MQPRAEQTLPSGPSGSGSTPLGDTFVRSLLTDVLLLDHLAATCPIIVTGGESWGFGWHGVSHRAATKTLVDLVRGDDRDKRQDNSAREEDPAEDAVDEDHADEARCPDAHGDGVLADPGGHLIAGRHASIGDQRGRAPAARLGGDGCLRARLAIGHHVSLRLLPDDLEYSIA